MALSPQALAVLRVRLAVAHAGGDTEGVSMLQVWPGNRGRSITIRAGWEAMQRSCARAGLRGVHWHTLRHTYASWLVMRGS